jgi:hypothetical protein
MNAPPPSHYSRLFRRYDDPTLDEDLRELAKRLLDWDNNHDNDDDDTNEEDNRKDRRRMPGSCSSGYAYLGQFITHDLSRPGAGLSVTGNEEDVNERTARLDLEQLYGNPPLVPAAKRNGPRLLLGETLGSPGLPPTDNDLPRDPEGNALIPDERNDFTLLIAQLHVLMIKFHNRIVDDLCLGNIPPASPADVSLFARAKRLVTWHYQWIVRYDYLPKLVEPGVLQDIVMSSPRLYWPLRGKALIPVEFAWAAFQYGHSAVQNSYNINPVARKITASDTFCLTGTAPAQKKLKLCADPIGNTRLPQRYVVEPGRMFGWAPPGISNVSEEIDTLIPSAFYHLSPEAETLFTNEESDRNGGRGPSLPEITFLRGKQHGLPSGQEACCLSGVQCLAADQLAHTAQLRKFLCDTGLDKRTPLFYYILREAEVAGRASVWGRPCKRLGPLGSRIVAEVILGVSNADPDCFMHSAWRPPLIRLRSGRTIRIESLKKLALYASGHVS